MARPELVCGQTLDELRDGPDLDPILGHAVERSGVDENTSHDSAEVADRSQAREVSGSRSFRRLGLDRKVLAAPREEKIHLDVR